MKICFYINEGFNEVIEITGDYIVTQTSIESNNYTATGINCPFIVTENTPDIALYGTFMKKIALAQRGKQYTQDVEALDQDVTITSLEELESRKALLTNQYFLDRNALIECTSLDDIKTMSQSYSQIKVNNIFV